MFGLIIQDNARPESLQQQHAYAISAVQKHVLRSESDDIHHRTYKYQSMRCSIYVCSMDMAHSCPVQVSMCMLQTGLLHADSMAFRCITTGSNCMTGA